MVYVFFLFTGPTKWSFAQALVVSFLSGLALILVVFIVACGWMTKGYRRATKHIRRLIVRSLPSLADDIEMAPKDVDKNKVSAESPKKGNSPKGGRKKRRIIYRRSEKKK